MPLLRPLVVAVLLAAGLLAPATASAGGSVRGYDISWPQCGAAYPAKAGFGIVGVNKGIVFSANPCLASEITWAGGSQAQLYANTGNPGPNLSSHWPTGQGSPRFCDPASPDSADCAFDYGYNAAADSYATAARAFTELGIATTPATSTWWLDVETSNSWRSIPSLNVSALQGAAYYFTSVAQVPALGIYSTSYQWNQITAGSTAFSANKSWVAGASNAKTATAKCSGAGFTGGGVALSQYISGGFDVDVRC